MSFAYIFYIKISTKTCNAIHYIINSTDTQIQCELSWGIFVDANFSSILCVMLTTTIIKTHRSETMTETHFHVCQLYTSCIRSLLCVVAGQLFNPQWNFFNYITEPFCAIYQNHAVIATSLAQVWKWIFFEMLNEVECVQKFIKKTTDQISRIKLYEAHWTKK